MGRRLPSLTALRAFEAAARLGSFTAAARELHVTHAAISRQIRSLEIWYGIKLFERHHRKVVLTLAGRSLQPTVTDAFDRVAAASKDLTSQGRAARFVLGVDPGLASLWLARRINAFLEREPSLEIEIIPSLAPSDLASRAMHAGIFFSIANAKWPKDDAELRRDALLHLHAFPVCSPALLSGPAGLKRPADLSLHRLLHEQSTYWWRTWLEAAGATSVDWSKGPIFHDTGLALNAAVAGEGIAIGDNVLAVEDLERSRLAKPFSLSVECGTYYLYWNKDSLSHDKFKPFCAWLRAICSAQMKRSAEWS